MSTNPTVSPKAAEAEPTPLRPEVIVEQLRVLRTQIPELTQLQQPNALNRASKLNPDFTQKAINLVDDAHVIEQAVGRTAQELREDLEEANRWTQVEDELKSILAGVVTANRVRRHRVGSASLLAYNIGLRISKQEEFQHLRNRVREMKLLPKFGVKRPKAPESPEAPETPQPQPKHS